MIHVPKNEWEAILLLTDDTVVCIQNSLACVSHLFPIDEQKGKLHQWMAQNRGSNGLQRNRKVPCLFSKANTHFWCNASIKLFALRIRGDLCHGYHLARALWVWHCFEVKIWYGSQSSNYDRRQGTIMSLPVEEEITKSWLALKTLTAIERTWWPCVQYTQPHDTSCKWSCKWFAGRFYAMGSAPMPQNANTWQPLSYFREH